MSISTVQQAFEEFERTSVRVADVENRAAKRVQAEFREAVQKALGAWYADSFLAGSYRRKTQAVHLKDLDIVIVLNDPTGELRASPSGALALMKGAAHTYSLVRHVEVKCRAVECELDGHSFWADLVPALQDGRGGLLLAYVDRKEGIEEWRPADPKGQVAACQAKNAATDGAYVPVTRICKFWNQSFTSSPSQEKPMPSYLVEAILHDALSGSCDWSDAVLAFFENAERHLSLPYPSVPCPGKSTDYVDEKLEDPRRLKALAKVQTVLPYVRAAANETDPYKAMDAWVFVFGQSFPAPSTKPGLIAKALRNRTATVVGTGVSVSSSGRQPIPVRSHGPAPTES
ncbi:MAG TPA: nucleotidyltransferase [Solirubrobacteraceae bacterium]|nr:nucleotidyltransferase [Solirubrobacteraceae bacterium]